MVYVILVNWNGWRDTIECLESVFRLDDSSFRVIVCDNASEDSSLVRIGEWAVGGLLADCSNPELRHLSFPPCPKPIRTGMVPPGGTLGTAQPASLLLVQTGGNLGFAGANNIGLRLALSDGRCDFVWFLNNDTVVEAQSLSRLEATMRGRPEIGICGSTVLHYHAPERVQALGGCDFNRWTARVRHIGRGLPRNRIPPCDRVERRLRYVSGAAMLVSRAFLESVGPMNESYFLYFEEIDWATRAEGRFGLAYCPESVVYHKEGATTGGAEAGGESIPLTEFYGTRSRVLFTRRYYPWSLPVVCASLIGGLLWGLLRGRWRNPGAVLRGFAAGLGDFASSKASCQNSRIP